jgi:hypothetical protein
MQLLAGREAVSAMPQTDLFRQKVQTAERITKLDEYFRQALEEKQDHGE